MRPASPICICKSSARRRKAGRPRAAGDLDTLWRIYDQHIKTPEAQDALGELIALIKAGKRVCLLCYERDPNQCHRSRIAALVKKRTRVQDRGPDPAAVLSYSAGCGAFCLPSTLTIIATRAIVVTNNNSAITAFTLKTSVKPPLWCRIEIMPIAAPALMNSRK